jgi:hypothetical protein
MLALCLLVAAPAAATIPVSKAEDPDYDPEAPPRGSEDDASGSRVQRREDSFGPGTSAPAPVPRFEGEQLRAVVPDLVVKPWPPPPHLLFGFGSIYPLQMAGAGLGFEGYPADFLSLSIYYSAGFSSVGQHLTFSSYGQARVGVRLFSFGGSYVRTVTSRSNAAGAPLGKPVFEAVLPAAHAVLLEAGVLSGSVPRLKCTANCDSTSTLAVVNPQLFYPMAGLRYVFNTNASSERHPRVDRAWQLQLHADMLFEPLNDSKESLLWGWGELKHVHRGHFGGMGGVAVPVCGNKFCFWLRVMGGYLPAPASPLVGFSFGG